jgi:hypothetical protein
MRARKCRKCGGELTAANKGWSRVLCKACLAKLPKPRRLSGSFEAGRR